MPIDTGDKIYIHMPKTGGSWMSEYLIAEHSGKRVGGHGHQPADTLKKHVVENKLLWATIRDPWSWYLSWYAHGMQAPHYQERLAVYGRGSLEFKDVLIGALSRDESRCPERAAAIWSITNEKKARDAYLKGVGGLYTWSFFHMFNGLVTTLVDTAAMPEGIRELFGVDVDTTAYPPANTRNVKLPKAPEEMYDDEMIDAVFDEDSFLISILGYEGPFTRLRRHASIRDRNSIISCWWPTPHVWHGVRWP